MDKKEKSINSHIDKAIGYSDKAHDELQIALNIALEGKGLSDEEKELLSVGFATGVEEAVGFKFEKYQGYQPNRTLTREYEITAIWVLSERYDTLDKKVWKKVDGVKLEDGYYIAIAPNKRSKQGKAIAAVLTSYKSFTHHFKILKELNIEVPHVSRFSITQLLRHKDRIFVYFDDSIRAEKQNPDFVEITIGEYEDFINSKD